MFILNGNAQNHNIPISTNILVVFNTFGDHTFSIANMFGDNENLRLIQRSINIF